MWEDGSGEPYRAAWWVPGAHAQTLWGKLVRKSHRVAAHVEVWETPDGDLLEMHRVFASPGSPRLFLLHGLEGTVRSHYVGGFLAQAVSRGWGADLLIFRGCGSVPNRARRFYHSGETEDLAFAVARVHDQFPSAPLLMAGVSLGGNVLLKWLGELGGSVPAQVRAAAAISVPFDLEEGSRFISRGFSRLYEAHFVKSLRRKAERKRDRFPDMFAGPTLDRIRTLYDFDEVVTAPVHGFLSAHDYYSRSSSLRFLAGIRRPTLLLSAQDDPFLPRAVLERVREIARGNPCLRPEFHARGGHVGFVTGSVPWRPAYYAERRACDFLARACGAGA